jgi:hypothetical protein
LGAATSTRRTRQLEYTGSATRHQIYAPDVLTAVVAAILLVSSSAPPDTTIASDPELEQMPLTLDDMPTGWAEDTSGALDEDDDDEPDVCENGEPAPFEFDEAHPDAPQATITFTAGFIDYVDQRLARLPSDDEVRDGIDLVRQAFERCPTTIGDDGSSLTVSEMSFPNVGDDSIAYRGTSDAVPFPVVFIIVGVDDKVMLLTGIGEGADMELLEDLIAIAVDRLD